MNNFMQPYPGKLLILICSVALLVFFSVFRFLAENASTGLWLMQTLPMLMVIPGVLKKQSRSLQWLCFLTLFYILHAVLLMFTPGLLIAGSIELALSFITFGTIVYGFRSRKAQHSVSTSTEPAPSTTE